jgi:hypothetical protein
MPRPWTDLSCNFTTTKKVSYSALNHKEIRCRSPGDFCTASHREDQGVYPGQSVGFVVKEVAGTEISPLCLGCCQIITPPMLYVLCLSDRDRPLTHNSPQTNNLTLSQDMEFVNKVALPKVFSRVLHFSLLIIIPPLRHSHSSTV